VYTATVRERVLVAVKRATYDRLLKVAVLNAQSLDNKSAAVHDMIVDKSLDVLAVTESWHDSAGSPSVIATTPPGYRVYERARPRKSAKKKSLAGNHGVQSCTAIHRVPRRRMGERPLDIEVSCEISGFRPDE